MEHSAAFEDLLFQQQTSGASDYYELQANFTFAENENENENESSVDACIVRSASHSSALRTNGPESPSRKGSDIPTYTEKAIKPSQLLEDVVTRRPMPEEFKGITNVDQLRMLVDVLISSSKVNLLESDQH